MVFTGTFEHTIDAKSRLAVPSEIRDLLLAPRHPGRTDASSGSSDSAETPTYLYVTLGEGQSLCLYQESVFEQRASELDESELDPEEILAYERVMFSLARRVEMDKQGRVRLPEHLLNMVKFGSDVVLIGVKDHLEIRDRATWLAQVQEILTKKPGFLVNPRRLSKKHGSTTSGNQAERNDR